MLADTAHTDKDNNHQCNDAQYDPSNVRLADFSDIISNESHLSLIVVNHDEEITNEHISKNPLRGVRRKCS